MLNANNIFSDDLNDEYRLTKVTDEDILKIEKLFGFKLPQSYIDLIKQRNGGTLKERKQFYYPTKVIEIRYDNGERIIEEKTCDEEYRIQNIYGIAEESVHSINDLYEIQKFGVEGNPFKNIGIPFGFYWDDFVYFFDYSNCESNGEPQIACGIWSNIYKDSLYDKCIIAQNFEEFISALQKDKASLSQDTFGAYKPTMEQYESLTKYKEYKVNIDFEKLYKMPKSSFYALLVLFILPLLMFPLHLLGGLNFKDALIASGLSFVGFGFLSIFIACLWLPLKYWKYKSKKNTNYYALVRALDCVYAIYDNVFLTKNYILSFYLDFAIPYDDIVWLYRNNKKIKVYTKKDKKVYTITYSDYKDMIVESTRKSNNIEGIEKIKKIDSYSEFEKFLSSRNSSIMFGYSLENYKKYNSTKNSYTL